MAELGGQNVITVGLPPVKQEEFDAFVLRAELNGEYEEFYKMLPWTRTGCGK